MTNRSISPNVLALRYAFECSIPALKTAALRHVQSVIRSTGGSTSRTVEKLGISASTYQRWLESIPAIREAHQGQPGAGKPGRKAFAKP